MNRSYTFSARQAIKCLLLLLTVASSVAMSGECVISPLCGPHFTLQQDSVRDSFAAFDTGVSNGMRFYERCLKVSNVCPDAKITVRFRVFMDPPLLLPVTIKGYIFYGSSFEEIVLINNSLSGDKADEQVEVDLKHSFPEGPANYTVCMMFEFQTTGSETQDLNYLNTIVFDWIIDSGFFAFQSS